MKSLLEIEAAIKELSTEETIELAEWLNNYLDDNWDRQMQDDLNSGKLDSLIAKAESDIAANYLKDFREVINNV